MGHFPPVLLTNRWMNQQEPTAAHLKKILQLCLYTHTLKIPTCPSVCPTLTLQASQHPSTPPTAIAAVCCIPSAERLKNDRNCLLRWLRQPWRWISLGAINERTGMEQTVREREGWWGFSVNWWWGPEPVTQHQTDHWHRARLTNIRPGSHLYVLFHNWNCWPQTTL